PLFCFVSSYYLQTGTTVCKINHNSGEVNRIRILIIANVQRNLNYNRL
ncbi:unnamed protein product, partial [Rotaria sordida]